MTHTYVISTGVWTASENNGVQPLGVGYSGHGDGLNNPAMQDAHGVGPLPEGFYTIGEPKHPIDHLGPLAMPLIPDAANEMHGRSAFFVHGDNRLANHTASDGCITLRATARSAINASTDKRLHVIAKVTG